MIPLSEDTFRPSPIFLDFLRWNIVVFINYNFQCFLNQRLDQQVPKYPFWLIFTSRGGRLVPHLCLKPPKLFVVWLLVSMSSAWIQIRKQYWSVCWQLGRLRPATTSSHTKPRRAAFSSSAPSHLQMAEGDVGVKAAFEILRQAPSSLPFIKTSPPRPVSLLTHFISAARSRSWSPVRFNHCLHMAFPAVLGNQENVNVRQIPTRTERWLVDLGGLCWGRS